MKAVWLVLVLAAACPAGASIQSGWLPMPDVRFGSHKRCLQALDKIFVEAQRASPGENRGASRTGDDVNIWATEGFRTRMQFRACAGATMTGMQSEVIAQAAPQPPIVREER